MHRPLEISGVLDLDRELRSLSHPQRRAGDRAVVGQHPHGRVGETLCDGRDPELEPIRVGQLDPLGVLCLVEACGSDGN